MSTNEEIVRLLQTGQDTDGKLMIQLWNQNKGFVFRMVRQYSQNMEADDLEQESFLAMCEAVNHYQEQAGLNFVSYWGLWIKQRANRYLQRDSMIPSHMYQAVGRYRRMVSKYQREQGRTPTDEEACSILDISEKQLKKIQRASYITDTVSLDAPIETEEGELVCLGEITPAADDTESDVLEEVQKEELKAVLWPLVDGLPREQSEVIRSRYQKRKSFREIGEEKGQTISHVVDVESKGLRELGRSNRARLLQPFLNDERIRGNALHGNGVEQFRRSWTSSTERTAIELAEGK